MVKEIKLTTYISETLIPFNVLSLGVHTLLPTFLSLLGVFVKTSFGSGVMLDCRLLYRDSYRVPIIVSFPSGKKQPQDTRSRVGRIWSLAKDSNVVFSQKSPNEI